MTNINSNILALRRKRLGYEQKQIAVLLGHKNTYQLSRYETGQRIPSFKEAIKLSVLYAIPLRTLFDRYFRQYRQELESSLVSTGLEKKMRLQQSGSADYCTYQETLGKPRIDDTEADNVRHHIKVLVEERSRKILGN
jgi:transcriptional regulator with XRE-family HTH domain